MSLLHRGAAGKLDREPDDDAAEHATALSDACVCSRLNPSEAFLSGAAGERYTQLFDRSRADTDYDMSRNR